MAAWHAQDTAGVFLLLSPTAPDFLRMPCNWDRFGPPANEPTQGGWVSMVQVSSWRAQVKAGHSRQHQDDRSEAFGTARGVALVTLPSGTLPGAGETYATPTISAQDGQGGGGG
mmetsp:Transcript_50627/g.90456  ORF Transcript_50627/g.90456 Transcript_50627/m.90456 type:complete len:114 (-) Transcript_50627:7-348(-)